MIQHNYWTIGILHYNANLSSESCVSASVHLFVVLLEELTVCSHVEALIRTKKHWRRDSVCILWLFEVTLS